MFHIKESCQSLQFPLKILDKPSSDKTWPYDCKFKTLTVRSHFASPFLIIIIIIVISLDAVSRRMKNDECGHTNVQFAIIMCIRLLISTFAKFRLQCSILRVMPNRMLNIFTNSV